VPGRPTAIDGNNPEGNDPSWPVGFNQASSVGVIRPARRHRRRRV